MPAPAHGRGRPLRSHDRWRELAPALSALHRVPADQAARILRIEPTVEAWHRRYAQLVYAGPHLDEQTFDRGINAVRTRLSTLDPTGG